MDTEQGESMITAITPTGNRPEAFSHLVKWIFQQTVKPDQWIVVDDGSDQMCKDQTMVGDPVSYIRREPKPDDPQHTLNLNMLTALPHVKGDMVVILEDDEYYAPQYVETMARYLESNKLVGIGHARYYHVISRGYSRHANISHASLAQTGFRKEMIPVVTSCATQKNKHYLDIRLWAVFGGRIETGRPPKGWERKIGDGGLVFDDSSNPLYVGIKGLPGRKGIGIGHKKEHYKAMDSDGSVLKTWIPKDDDREVYERYWNE
jgi:hypothetical protein